MKKNLIGKIITVVLAIAMSLTCFSLVACGKDNCKTNKNPVSFEKAYDSSALGGIGLLSGSEANAVNVMSVDKANNIVNIFSEEKSEEVVLTEAMKENILKNLDIAQSTISGNSEKSEIVKSDKEGYEKMYTISAVDINGEKVEYTFYFNETPVIDNDQKDEEKTDETVTAQSEEKTEPVVEEEKEETEKEETEEETEVETNMKGIVIVGDKTYDITGERETEADEEEFSFTIKTDENNYVTVEQERGVEGQEFEYTLVKDGKEVFTSEVEYKIDKDGNVEMSFETENEKGEEVEYEYKFVTKDNKDYIKVEMEINEKESEVIINVIKKEDGTVEYQFAEENTKESVKA